MRIGDRVYVHGFIDEIRKDCIIIRNEGGYFGTIKSEIISASSREDIIKVVKCKNCKHWDRDTIQGVTVPGSGYCKIGIMYGQDEDFYCPEGDANDNL